MNKILITGMALGAEPEIGACQVCDYDMSWLFGNPSSLLWADKVIITPKIEEAISKGWFHHENKNIGKSITAIFEQLEKYNVLERKNPSTVISPEIRDSIFEEIGNDRKNLSKTFPVAIKQGNEEDVPGSIYVEESEYCSPVLWSLYAGMILANEWNANVLYQERGYKYFKYKFGLTPHKAKSESEKFKAFDELFSVFLPETGLVPTVWYDEKCKACAHETKCDSSAINEIENKTKEILNWRNYDELFELREIVSSIAEIKNDKRIITAEEIKDRFEEKERMLNKRINLIFPKVQRWTNMLTILSLPAIVAGVSTGSPIIASAGASVGGLATVGNKYIEILKSKYRWLGFRNKTKNV